MQARAFDIENAETRILTILKENIIGVVEDDTIRDLCPDISDEVRAQVINQLLVKQRIQLLTTQSGAAGYKYVSEEQATRYLELKS